MRLNRSRAILTRGITPTSSGKDFRESRQGTPPKPPAMGPAGKPGGMPGAGNPAVSLPHSNPQGRTPAQMGGAAPGYTPRTPGTPTGMGNPILPHTGLPGMPRANIPMETAPHGVQAQRGNEVRSIYDAPDALSPFQFGRSVGSLGSGGVGMFTTTKQAMPYSQPIAVDLSKNPAPLDGAERDAYLRQKYRGWAFGPQKTAGTDPASEFAKLAAAAQNGPFGSAQDQGGDVPGAYEEPTYEQVTQSQQQADRQQAQPSIYGTSSSALQSSEEGQETGHVVNESAHDQGGESDYLGAVYNEEGVRVDPVTGQPYDSGGTSDYNPTTGGTQQYPGSVNEGDYSSSEGDWINFLRSNGYDVVEENGQTYIRGENGRGDSGSYHGFFGDPDDWTESIRQLRGKYEEEHAAQMRADAARRRHDALQENLDLLPDAPQIGEGETNALIEARNQRAAFNAAQANQAALAGASRARLGAGAISGLTAQSGNQLAVEQGAAAAEMLYRVKMSNFEAQRQSYQNQINMIQQFIQGEQDAASKEMAHKQLKEIIRLKASIDQQMLNEQLAQQERGQNFQFAGDIVNTVGGIIGSVAGGG